MAAVNLFEKFYVGTMLAYRVFCCKKAARKYFQYLRDNNIPIQKLSVQEKQAVKSLWGGIGALDYSTHVLMKSIIGVFDAKIMPEMVFRTGIELKLNHPTFKNAWSDKSYFEMFFPELAFPKTVVRNVSGQFLNEKYEPITFDDALATVENMDSYIIKPSIESGFGRGVELIKKDGPHELVLKKYGTNYVIQEVFKQHPVLGAFNASSVNVIRIVTLYLDGEVCCVTSALRCGGEGEICDNTTTEDGTGMVIIGMDEHGVLRDKAYYANGTYIKKMPNGTEFCGVQIPGYEKMVEMAKKSHKKIPYFKFIGWDFVLGGDGEPVVMEYNIKGPGIIYYQYTNGPLFGEYTEKVIDWAKKQK